MVDKSSVLEMDLHPSIERQYSTGQLARQVGEWKTLQKSCRCSRVRAHAEDESMFVRLAYRKLEIDFVLVYVRMIAEPGSRAMVRNLQSRSGLTSGSRPPALRNRIFANILVSGCWLFLQSEIAGVSP
jgi:hypothetical protein